MPRSAGDFEENLLRSSSDFFEDSRSPPTRSGQPKKHSPPPPLRSPAPESPNTLLPGPDSSAMASGSRFPGSPLRIRARGQWIARMSQERDRPQLLFGLVQKIPATRRITGQSRTKHMAPMVAICQR